MEADELKEFEWWGMETPPAITDWCQGEIRKALAAVLSSASCYLTERDGRLCVEVRFSELPTKDSEGRDDDASISWDVLSEVVPLMEPEACAALLRTAAEEVASDPDEKRLEGLA